MGKADEFLAKKRNKAARKRLSNTVDFTHGIEAARRRRKAGRRRICEGMCYSLPTPEDPFNDRYKNKLAKKNGNKVQEGESKDSTRKPGSKRETEAKENGRRTGTKLPKLGDVSSPAKSVCAQNSGLIKLERMLQRGGRGEQVLNTMPLCKQHADTSLRKERVMWSPSKKCCVNRNGTWIAVGGDAFETAVSGLLNAGILKAEEEETKNVGRREVDVSSGWDWPLWEACGSGSDILALGRAVGIATHISGVLAATAHIAARRVLESLSSDTVVLFVVLSREQTLQVRSMCKVIKPLLGFHSVSLHTGTSMEHQIEGLRSTSAEILVATPDRLCDLLSMDAVSLSSVSLMVVDGLEDMVSSGYGDQLINIRSKAMVNVQTLVIGNALSQMASNICRKLLKDPIYRVISSTSISQCSACIDQIARVIVSEDGRLQKLLKVIKDYFEGGQSVQLLVLCQQSQSLLHVKAALLTEGYTRSGETTNESQSYTGVLEQLRNGDVEVLLSTEDHLAHMDLGGVGTIIFYEFPSTMDVYSQTLMRMARHTIHGALYSFCSGGMAPLAVQLAGILRHCQRPVPPSLKMLAEAAALVEKQKT